MRNMLFLSLAIVCSASSAMGQALTVTATAGASIPDPCLINSNVGTPVNATSTPAAQSFTWSVESVLCSPASPPTDVVQAGYYTSFEDPNAAQTNFISVSYTEGYWRFKLRVDAFNPAVGNYQPAQSGFARVNVDVTAVKLIIKRK